MSGKKSTLKFDQPKSFTFSKENLKRIETILSKYPESCKRSGIMPLLDLVQRQNQGWIPEAAMKEIARILETTEMAVYEVATFYTMYHLQPIGKHHIQCCTTTPCWLRGSADVVKAAEKKLKIKLGETTKDGQFTMSEVECLGACVNAPMVQVNDDYFEDLSAETIEQLIDDLKAGKKVTVGSQTGRIGSCAQLGPTSLGEQAKAAGVDMAEHGQEE